MKANTLIKYLVLILVVLIAINVSIIIMFNKQDDSEVVLNSIRKVPESSEIDFANHFFTHYLQLTPEQIEDLKDISSNYLLEKRELSIEIANANMKLGKYIIDGINRDEQQEVYDTIIRLHKDIKLLSYQYYTNLSEMCDDKQRELLKKFYQSSICIDNSQCDLYKQSALKNK